MRAGIGDGRFAAGAVAAGVARRDDSVYVVSPGRDGRSSSLPGRCAVLGDPELADLLRAARACARWARSPRCRRPRCSARFGAPAAAPPVGPRASTTAGALARHRPSLVETAELDPPAVRVDDAAFVGKGLADRLLDRLDALGLACTRGESRSRDRARRAPGALLASRRGAHSRRARRARSLAARRVVVA